MTLPIKPAKAAKRRRGKSTYLVTVQRLNSGVVVGEDSGFLQVSVSIKGLDVAALITYLNTKKPA